MKKKLANYDLIITDDGSTTLYSKLYGENCHSTSGARAETQLHYLKGCKVAEQMKINNPITIFEVGLGVGIGFEETLKLTQDHPCFYITTEIDEDLVKYVISSNDIYKGITKYTTPFNYYLLEKENLRLIILIGNARKTTPRLNELGDFKFNCIYQDAFSPRRNAILWTKEWFELLLSYSDNNCIMSTYSASSSIRKSMVAAGWKLSNGEKFGPKRSSTRATLTGQTDSEILGHLDRSPVAMITDDNYHEYTLEK